MFIDKYKASAWKIFGGWRTTCTHGGTANGWWVGVPIMENPDLFSVFYRYIKTLYP